MSVRCDTCRLEPLADTKGTYGVAVVGEDHPNGWDDTRLVLRPDKVGEHPPNKSIGSIRPILQPIPRHLRRCFRWAGEAVIADHFFTALLAKAGLERNKRDPIWWADTKAGRDKNRQKYYALQAKALAVTNFQMRQVLDNCPQDALKASRRFRPLNRHAVYCEIIRGPRFLQLVDN